MVKAEAKVEDRSEDYLVPINPTKERRRRVKREQMEYKGF